MDELIEGDGRPVVLYHLLNAQDEIIYIGKTVDIEQRFRNHAWYKPWWPEVARHTERWFGDAFTAETLELAAIIRECPRYNVVGTPEFARKLTAAVRVPEQHATAS